MTKDEAIAIRARQLAGETVAPALLAEAIAVICNDAEREKKQRRALRPGSRPEVLLGVLLSGRMGRDALMAQLPHDYRYTETITKLIDRGLVRDEVRLTEDGLRALGLQGPDLEAIA